MDCHDLTFGDLSAISGRDTARRPPQHRRINMETF